MAEDAVAVDGRDDEAADDERRAGSRLGRTDRAPATEAEAAPVRTRDPHEVAASGESRKDKAVRVLKRFASDIGRDDVDGLSAELAYRFLFAIFPFGIFVAALTAFVAQAFGIEDPTGRILGSLSDNLPADVANGIRPQLEAVIGKTQPGLLTFGAIAALWAATG